MVNEEIEIEEIDFLDAKTFINSLIKREERTIKNHQILFNFLERIGVYPLDLKELKNIQFQNRVRVEALTRLLMRVNDLEKVWKARRDEDAKRTQEERLKFAKKGQSRKPPYL